VELSAVITLGLIVVTSLVSYFAFSNPRLMNALILWPPAVTRGHQWHRLLSYGVVHADFAHLLFNMITLYFFGSVMERVYAPYIGPFGYLLFYLGGLLVAILPSYIRHRNDADYRSLGASGAVSAVLFGYILIEPWSLLLVFFVPVPAIVFAVLYVGYTIWMERRGTDRINHTAHLWGAVYGVVFTLLLEPRIAGLFLQRLLSPSF
jgi:membrane associated rhomboid family serine protease